MWILGGATGALAGVLLGTTAQGVQYDMGFRILLLIFAAVVVGGLGTAFGAMLGGILIGVVTEVSTLWIDTDFKTAIALGVLIVVLLIRPQGILGQRARVAWTGRRSADVELDKVLSDGLRAAVGVPAAAYALAAIGLNLQYGYTGLLNFGQVGFLLVGRVRHRDLGRQRRAARGWRARRRRWPRWHSVCCSASRR